MNILNIPHHEINNYDLSFKNVNNQVVAFFDFDGTITFKDTFIEFIKYYKGIPKFLLGMLLLSPILILFKLKLIRNWKAKEIVLSYFFEGENIEKFKNKCNNYSSSRISKITRKKALEYIEIHKKSNHDIFVVSASAEMWLSKWCEKMEIKLISTKLEIENSNLTGKILGKNCYGIEKVKRIKEEIDLDKYNLIFAYGDSRGDKEMLEIADYPYYRFF